MDEYVARPAREEDLRDLVRMRRALMDFHLTIAPRTLASTPERLEGLPDFYRERLRDPESRLLVAVHAPTGAVVGMALGTIEHHEDRIPPRSGRVGGVWIDPSHRRRGLCRALLAELTAFFRAQGLDRATLWFATANPAAASTWSRFGFEPIYTMAEAPLDEIEARINARAPGLPQVAPTP